MSIVAIYLINPLSKPATYTYIPPVLQIPLLFPSLATPCGAYLPTC